LVRGTVWSLYRNWFLTVVPFVGYYLLLAYLYLVADPTTGVVVMAIYGLIRGLPVLLVAVATVPGQSLEAVASPAAVAGYEHASKHVGKHLRNASLVATVLGGLIALGQQS